jgi:hypothetical protein
MGFDVFFEKATPVPLRRKLFLHQPVPSPVDEVLDGLGSLLGRWVRTKAKRLRRTN